MVRPILEHGNVIWGPHYVLDQRKLEGVQRRATKLVTFLRDKSCIDRLTSMNLPSLLYRYKRGDLYFFQDNNIIIINFTVYIYLHTYKLQMLV